MTKPPTEPLARARHARLDTSLELLLAKGLTRPGPKILATIVSTAGSTYRKPGARMLIMEDGSYLGLLSGGCLESDLRLHAEEVLRTGKARAIEYDMRGPDDELFGVGAGCEGAMRVLLEPAGSGTTAAAALAEAAAVTRAGRPISLVMVHQSTTVGLGTYLSGPPLSKKLTDASAMALREARSIEPGFDAEERDMRVFIQYLAPAPHLLICGAGPDAQSVSDTAVALGWRVTVVDHRPYYATAEKFPGAAVVAAAASQLSSVVNLGHCHAAVVMSHHLASDAEYLRALSQSPTPEYVGLLGPRARRERLAHEIGEAMNSLSGRLHGPVGLDLGAQTPEGIALAIVSQVHAHLADRVVDPPLLRVPEPKQAKPPA